MSEMQALIETVVDWVRTNGINGARAELTPDTDLLSARLLDSLGLVQLVAFIEAESGGTIDFLELEPEQFTTIRGLCTVALSGAP